MVDNSQGRGGEVTFNDNSRVNNFVGAPNLLTNVKAINRPIEINKINKGDRQKIFQGLGNFTDKVLRDYVWSMVNSRLNSLPVINPNIQLN